MNAPNPLFTRTAETLAPPMSLIASTVGGLPLAALTVSLLNRTVFKAVPLTTDEALAYGGVGAAVFGYAFHIAKTLIDRAIARADARV